MEREIKFKGKNEKGEVLFGYLLSFDGKYYIFDKYFMGYFATHRVIPETIAQFTGLVDKNGKEIFHKDRFKTNKCIIKSEVVYCRGAFGYMAAGDDERFVSFAENFANLKGKNDQLNAVEVVEK